MELIIFSYFEKTIGNYFSVGEITMCTIVFWCFQQNESIPYTEAAINIVFLEQPFHSYEHQMKVIHG